MVANLDSAVRRMFADLVFMQGGSWGRLVKSVMSASIFLDIDWHAYHAPFRSIHTVLELPSYGWDLKEYFIAYENHWCTYKPYGPPHNVKPDLTYKQVTFDPGRDERTLQPQTEPRTSAIIKIASEVPEPPNTAVSEFAKPQSTTVHKMVKDDLQAPRLSLVYETDLTRSDVHRVVQGHVVNNIPFCTPSVFADMAFILGDYVLNRFYPDKRAILEAAGIVAEKVLISHGRGP